MNSDKLYEEFSQYCTGYEGEKKHMNSNELYEEFLKQCKEYETDSYGIVIRRGDSCLRIRKPQNSDNNSILYYDIIQELRTSGYVSDLDELLELCEETFGEDIIIKHYGHR